jgi:ATP-dependent DNA helicase RecG
MTASELEILMADLESDRVERKASISDPGDIRKAICAFANDLAGHREPGVLFVGIHDNGQCASLNITDQIMLTLANMRSDGNIVPLPSMTVQKKTLLGCEVIVVEVQPSDAPPVRYKGTIWVRIGPRKAEATAQDEQRLIQRRRAFDLPFDLRPLPSASFSDLDLTFFEREYLPNALSPEALEANNRTVEQRLASLRFITPEPNEIPTVIGILTIGIDTRGFVPGSYIQFLRIDGTDLSDPIKDQDEIGGPIPDMLHHLDEKLAAHISIASDFAYYPTEIRTPDYPIAALQQLARNAVLHREYEGTNAPVRITWFNDRIEIQNPGGPYGQVTKRNFGQPGITDYRNPHLAEVMKNLGYVQRFGAGIQIARRELANNGNPELQFTVEDTYVLALIPKKQ